MIIFKICHRAEWEAAERDGLYNGSSKDRADGFLHFSKAEQLPETLRRYYAGIHDLLLVAVEADDLEKLKFEASRNGELFPHLYAPLPAAKALWARPLPLAADGVPVIPKDIVS